MLSTTELFIATKWFGIATIGFFLLTTLGFILNWGFRFRLVGVTGFMGVLTAGLFGLRLKWSHGSWNRFPKKPTLRYTSSIVKGCN